MIEIEYVVPVQNIDCLGIPARGLALEFKGRLGRRANCETYTNLQVSNRGSKFAGAAVEAGDGPR